jgi:hypothetical protein
MKPYAEYGHILHITQVYIVTCMAVLALVSIYAMKTDWQETYQMFTAVITRRGIWVWFLFSFYFSDFLQDAYNEYILLWNQR